MKTKTIIWIPVVVFIPVAFLILSGCNDYPETGPGNYSFLFEGGNLNRVRKDNKSIIDSGAVDFEYTDDYVVFSVDTTYANKPQEIAKSKLVYYLYDVKKDVLNKPVGFSEFRKLVKEHSLEEIDISQPRE